MMKKLLSLVCCLLPIGAVADVLVPETGDMVSTSQFPTDGSAVVIGGGNGISASDGLTVENNMYVGAPNDMGANDGSLVALDTVGSPFTVESAGNVSIGALLQVLDGYNLGIKTTGTGYDVSIGSLNNAGTFKTENINTFMSGGAMTSNGALNIDANDKIEINGLTASGTTTLSAGTNGVVSGGTIQNNSGQMTITSGADVISGMTGADVTITGNLENSGDGMTILGKDISVTGTMKNDSQNGLLKIEANSLTVSGNDAFVNNGSINWDVAGTTSLAGGFSLANMGTNNTFSLVTGQLDLGTNNSLVSNQSVFLVNVTKGNLVLGAVENNNNMNLTASGNITTGTVENQGKQLVVDATNVTIAQALTGGANATTQVMVDNKLTVGSALSNAGSMTLSGHNVSLQSVVNSGARLDISAETMENSVGVIDIAGDLTNSNGVLDVSATDVTITGALVNNSGTMKVVASNTAGGNVQVGAIQALGGVIYMDALGGKTENNELLPGGTNASGNLIVSGGAFNTGTSLQNLVIDGAVKIDGDLSASATQTSVAGNMNVAVAGAPGFTMTADSISIGGGVNLTANDTNRNLTFIAADDIYVSNGINVGKMGNLTLNAENSVETNAIDGISVDSAVFVDSGGVLNVTAEKLLVDNMNIDGLFVMQGTQIVANGQSEDEKKAALDINGNLYFGLNGTENPSAGLVVDGTDTLTLVTTRSGEDIAVGAVSVNAGNALEFQSAGDVYVKGQLETTGKTTLNATGLASVTGEIDSSSDLMVSGASVSVADVSFSGSVGTIKSTGGDVQMGKLANSGNLLVNSSNDIKLSLVEHSAGQLDLIAADTVSGQGMTVSGDGAVANVNAKNLTMTADINVAGDMVHGGTDGMLNVMAGQVSANNLKVGGNLILASGDTNYTVVNNITANSINVADGVNATLGANWMQISNQVENSGNITLIAQNGMQFGGFINNAGNATLNSGDGFISVSDFAINAGTVSLDGAGLYVDNSLEYGDMLYHGYDKGNFNIVSDEYEITADKLDVKGIAQKENNTLIVNSSNINVNSDIVASDLRFVAQTESNGQTTWQDVTVGGDISGNVDFIGLGQMTVKNGDYTFDSGSMINAAILPASGNTGAANINYWANVSLLDNGTLGQITNPTGNDARALIQVGGTFTAGASNTDVAPALNSAALAEGQIGITLFNSVDQGSAIWFLHADGGVNNLNSLDMLRNLDVRYCNATGSLCYDYLTSLDEYNATDDDLPAYISVRDSNQDGVSDDLYIVFDPRFGGPVLLNNSKLQPIVGRTDNHTYGEYVSAGALDNLIASRLHHTQFSDTTPIEALPLMFQGTNMETMANELYLRLENYAQTANGNALTNFARLFQADEIEQIMGGMVLNEHTTFRSFEDYMYNEFIWNRNRNLKKAWLDVDYGMFYQNIQGGVHSDGNRFSIAGGFDWQHSDTLVLGLTGRVSRTASDVDASVNLGFGKNQALLGRVHSNVADTDIAFGGYLMKILGEKARMYGNAFADIHFLDIERNQDFVAQIEGNGTAFSLTTEWGLMHDILNQYIVGNLYARAGYNFGFDITEKAGGTNYMDLKSDGYAILTPGYSVMAQKRIYPSAWFQIRPYASIGVEYDLLDSADSTKYKFALADSWSRYDVDINPLWANIGGGIEILSANGLQFGLDYRYQYNDAIQLHNIKISGSYRF